MEKTHQKLKAKKKVNNFIKITFTPEFNRIVIINIIL